MSFVFKFLQQWKLILMTFVNKRQNSRASQCSLHVRVERRKYSRSSVSWVTALKSKLGNHTPSMHFLLQRQCSVEMLLPYWAPRLWAEQLLLLFCFTCFLLLFFLLIFCTLFHCCSLLYMYFFKALLPIFILLILIIALVVLLCCNCVYLEDLFTTIS